MIPVLLIGANFLREQRWPLIVLLLWVVGSSAVVAAPGVRADSEDVLFFLKQQAVYGVAVTTFLAASAVYNERRSRRILAVLSKGIERKQYLAGLLAGVFFVIGIYCAFMTVACAWVFTQIHVPLSDIPYLMSALLASSLLSGSLAIFFSTFLHPLVAAAATAIFLALPAVLAHIGSQLWLRLIPVYWLMTTILEFAFRARLYADWTAVGMALSEAVAVWLAASWVFTRRDVAVAVE